jgi:tetratricopeptide (TPR) repeat protein
MYRELARVEPDVYQTEVAGTLMNLGGIYRDTGRMEEAARTYESALSMARALAMSGGEESRADLALALHKLGSSLNNLGNLYRETHRMLDAERVYMESIAIRQELLQSGSTSFNYHPAEVKAGLALALGNLAGTYMETGRTEEAEQPLIQALDLYRELAKSDRDEFLPGLANMLDLWLGFLFDTRQFDRAVEPSWESILIWRELANRNPGRYRSNFIGSLTRSASLLSISGRKAEVSDLVSGAIAIGRELYEENPAENAKTYAEILVTSAIVSNSPDDPAFCQDLREAFEVSNDNDIRQYVQNRLRQCTE